MTRLYVGNLSYETSEEELWLLFGRAGRVLSTYLPLDHHSGYPRGFGFVEMDGAQATNAAMTMFDGYEFHGRQIRVNIARPRELWDRRGGYEHNQAEP